MAEKELIFQGARANPTPAGICGLQSTKPVRLLRLLNMLLIFHPSSRRHLSPPRPGLSAAFVEVNSQILIDF